MANPPYSICCDILGILFSRRAIASRLDLAVPQLGPVSSEVGPARAYLNLEPFSTLRMERPQGSRRGGPVRIGVFGCKHSRADLMLLRFACRPQRATFASIVADTCRGLDHDPAALSTMPPT